MQTYIIITCTIEPVGGMQLYTAGKAEFLERNGWKVFVFHPCNADCQCAYKYLNKYSHMSFPAVGVSPFAIDKSAQKKVLRKMVETIGYKRDSENSLLYIESQHGISALWGELLAKQINGHHINFNCNEKFRGKSKGYDDNLAFFAFKYSRRELYGLRPDSLVRLFDKYIELSESNDYVFDAVEPNPIQDVESEMVNNLPVCDFNICYIGRASKEYVPNILEGVCSFAKKHFDKSIQLIIVGNADERKKTISEMVNNCKNLNISLLGDLVPIPRSLYKKIDVVIAGAVCAEISAREGVPTIVADCDCNQAIGVLGYTVQNSMYSEGIKTSFDKALESTLIDLEYLNSDYSFPKALEPDEIFRSHLRCFEKADCSMEYYCFNTTKRQITRKGMKILLRVHFPYMYNIVSFFKKHFMTAHGHRRRSNCQFTNQ